MKKNITVSIIPSYKCHYKCPFCFLGKLREDFTLLKLEKLEENLKTISEEYIIDQIDLFGGELGEINENYLRHLLNLCLEYNPNRITITTNFLNNICLDLVKEYENKANVTLAISLNKERSRNNYIEWKLETAIKEKSLPKSTELVYVVLPSLLNYNKIELLEKLQRFNLPVIFLRYNPSNLNHIYNISTLEYSKFLRDLIASYRENSYTFPLGNLDLLNMDNDPTIESNVFINPYGQYGWIEFKQDKEVYKYSDKYLDWKSAIFKDISLYEKHCASCKYYYGKCQAEHLNFLDNEIECCGLKGLLDWNDSTDLY